jgi:L-asparaginase
MKKILLVLLCFCWAFFSEAQNLPRVIVLGTGGTIAGQGANADRAGYIPGKIPIEDILSSIPSANKIAVISGEQIASVGSYDMTIGIWLKLAKRINEIFANDEADGIVITHGTDTQEETAFFLNLTMTSDKPVVLTGAMRPATAISADGPKNLYDAIVVASDPKSVGRGVILSFNETLYDANHVVKINTTHVDAFESPDTGPIGQVYDGKVSYYSQALPIKNDFTHFDISSLDSLPKVEIVYMYVGASATPITALLNDQIDGLIIAGSGNGSFNKPILQAVEAGVKKGKQIVRSTRVVSGRVTPGEVFNDNVLGTIASNNMNPQKARILLMLALTVSQERGKINEIFQNF